jgi:hypothetical protein
MQFAFKLPKLRIGVIHGHRTKKLFELLDVAHSMQSARPSNERKGRRVCVASRGCQEERFPCGSQTIAPSARSLAFQPLGPSPSSSTMVLLEILVQIVVDCIRDVFVEILGRRAEELFVEHLKRKDRQKKRLPGRGPARRARLKGKR